MSTRVAYPIWLLHLAIKKKWAVRSKPDARQRIRECIAAIRTLRNAKPGTKINERLHALTLT